jgi:hypothetical protein
VKTPLLELDIKVPSGKKAKLVVYPGDEANFVAHRFAAKHALLPEKEQKLAKVIRASIAMYLVKQAPA